MDGHIYKHICKRELRGSWVSITVWSVVMFSMAAMGFSEYGAVVNGGVSADFSGMMATMPRVIQIMFGMGFLPIDTPEGWFVCLYLWCALIAYIHAALLGAGILAKEESDRTADFLFTRPVTRAAVINAKVLAACLNLAVVVVTGWASTMLIFCPQAEGMAGLVTLTMLPGMYVTALVFLFAGLFLSSCVQGRGRAAQYASGLLMVTYLLAVAIQMVGDVEYLNFLSPFRYFDAVRVYENGMEWPYVLLSALWVAAAWYGTHVFFRKKDLRS